MLMKILRAIIAIAAIVFLIWFIAPVAFGIFNIGNMLGIFLCAAVFFRSALSPLYKKIKKAMLKRSVTKVLLRVVQTISIAFIAYSVIVSGCMVYAMIPRDMNGATAVVLGAQVKPWGPSVLLRQRINAAEGYLNSDPKADAVVTGGQGPDEIMSEAECMKQTMTADGIAAERIFMEDKATNTDENIRFSLKVIEDNGLNINIAIVTDSYHQFRARLIAHKADSSVNVGPVNTTNNYIGLAAYPTYFVREWIAIPVELIK